MPGNASFVFDQLVPKSVVRQFGGVQGAQQKLTSVKDKYLFSIQLDPKKCPQLVASNGGEPSLKFPHMSKRKGFDLRKIKCREISVPIDQAKAAKAKAITISKTFFSHTIDINYGTSMLGKAKGAESIRTEHERRKARKESSGEQTATNYVIQESFDDDDIRLGESASTHGENDSELYSRDVVTLEPPR